MRAGSRRAGARRGPMHHLSYLESQRRRVDPGSDRVLPGLQPWAQRADPCAGRLRVRYFVRYFKTRTLTPFAIYCVVVGVGSIIYVSVR